LPVACYGMHSALMVLDIRTLLITVALATFVCAGARLLLWRLHPSIPGLGKWALAAFLAAIALALITTRGRVPDLVSLTLPAILMTFGFLVVWEGFRAFLGMSPLPKLVRALAVILPVILTVMGHLSDSFPLRSIINALCMVVFSCLIAWDLLRVTDKKRLSLKVAAGLYLSNGFFALLRAMSVRIEVHDLNQMQYSNMAASSLLWWLFSSISITLCMVMMTGEVLQENLDRLASLDPLTGVMNRRAFGHQSVRELARSRRLGQTMAVLMMDLDHFKLINDRLGHATGDIVLRLFVSVAQKVLRQEDIFCRWGGEEFVALLPGTTLAQAWIAAERLRTSFQAEAMGLAPEAAELGFTVSIGVAEWRLGEEIEELLRRADHALYRAKERGRNRCETAVTDGMLSARPQGLQFGDGHPQPARQT